MGLTVVYPPTGVSAALTRTVDIVIIHGLNGDETQSWTHPETKTFWPKDFLPYDIPEARVLTFGYNANAAFGNTTADIADHAKDLLGSLIDKREEEDENQRPIIFIAHSLGGIVVKQALFLARIESRYSSICEYTIGIIFFGTPHRGSDKATYGKILVNVASTVIHSPSSKLLSALQSNSDTLAQLTSVFRDQLPQYEIVSFYERKPLGMFKNEIVEKQSALLEVAGEDQVPVDGNHIDMCKFAERNNGDYEKLFKRIRRILNDYLKKLKQDAPKVISGQFGATSNAGSKIAAPINPNPSNQLEFMMAVLEGRNDDVQRYLRENRHQININEIESTQGQPPITIAVIFNHVSVVRSLIEAGADVNITDRNGFAPLGHALKNTNLELIKILLDAKADNLPQVLPNWSIFGPNTYLTEAVRMGRGDIVDLLVEANVDINNPAHIDGGTWAGASSPLVKASRNHRDHTMTRRLLEAHADPNAPSGCMTPLLAAASPRNTENVKVLLEYNADPDLLHWGHKPRDLLESNQELKSILVSHAIKKSIKEKAKT